MSDEDLDAANKEIEILNSEIDDLQLESARDSLMIMRESARLRIAEALIKPELLGVYKKRYEALYDCEHCKGSGISYSISVEFKDEWPESCPFCLAGLDGIDDEF